MKYIIKMLYFLLLGDFMEEHPKYFTKTIKYMGKTDG